MVTIVALEIPVWQTPSGIRCEVWLAVSWGQPPCTLGLHTLTTITIPRILPASAWGPTTNIDFYFQHIIWRMQPESSKHPCSFRTWMGFAGQILIKLEMYFIQGSLPLLLWCSLGNNLYKHTGGHSVTTDAHLTCAGLCGMEVWKLIGAICDMRSNMPTRMIDHHVLTVSADISAVGTNEIPPIHRSNNIYIYIYKYIF